MRLGEGDGGGGETGNRTGEVEDEQRSFFALGGDDEPELGAGISSKYDLLPQTTADIFNVLPFFLLFLYNFLKKINQINSIKCRVLSRCFAREEKKRISCEWRLKIFRVLKSVAFACGSTAPFLVGMVLVLGRNGIHVVELIL